MSPEQVEGKDTDERSDIFSFGIVLYEMITGQRPFTGDTQAAVLAALLKDQPPPMSQRQPAVPRALERVVRKCLEKKPDDRWHSAQDLKPTLELIDLDAPPTSMSSASVSVPIPVQTPKKGWLWPSVAAAVVLALGAAGTYAYLNREIPVPEAIRFEIGLPGSGGLGGAAVSPDGRQLAFVARGADGQTKLWIRSLSTSEARPLDGTDGVTGAPFWSWDSRSVVFGADGKLKKMEAAGGPAQTLCTIQGLLAWRLSGRLKARSYSERAHPCRSIRFRPAAELLLRWVPYRPWPSPRGFRTASTSSTGARAESLSLPWKKAPRKLRGGYWRTIPPWRTSRRRTPSRGICCLCGEPQILRR